MRCLARPGPESLNVSDSQWQALACFAVKVDYSANQYRLSLVSRCQIAFCQDMSLNRLIEFLFVAICF